MATDFTKLPLAILVDLINATNGCALTTNDITFSPPSALVSGNRNTGILVTAAANSPYSGSRYLSYNRVDMASIPGLRSTEFVIGDATTMSELVPEINAAYRINLQPEDYFDDPLPSPTDLQSVHFTLRAKPASYIYQGSLELTVRTDKKPLPDYLTTYVLSGFLLPAEMQLSGDHVLNGFQSTTPPPP